MSPQQTVTAEPEHVIDCAPWAVSGEDYSKHSEEENQLAGPFIALSREALERHTQDLEPSRLVNQIRTIKRISGLLCAEDSVFEQESDRIDVDPQEIFNYEWGYLLPLSEEAECILIALVENPAIANIIVRTNPGTGEFRIGLEGNRNVKIYPSSDPDPRADAINAADLEGFLEETADQQRCYDELWMVDRVKCTEDSSEALFQRTLMMSLIARHTVIYQRSVSKGQVLGFSVEEVWQCPPMPTKAV